MRRKIIILLLSHRSIALNQFKYDKTYMVRLLVSIRGNWVAARQHRNKFVPKHKQHLINFVANWLYYRGQHDLQRTSVQLQHFMHSTLHKEHESTRSMRAMQLIGRMDETFSLCFQACRLLAPPCVVDALRPCACAMEAIMSAIVHARWYALVVGNANLSCIMIPEHAKALHVQVAILLWSLKIKHATKLFLNLLSST